MPSATGDTGAEQPMRAWKFLDPGRIAPFGGHVWPAPSTSGPGAWVEPAGGVDKLSVSKSPLIDATGEKATAV